MSTLTLPRWWDHFWFAPQAPPTIGLFRILFGSILTLLLLADFPNWEKLYGPAGAYPLDIFLKTRSFNPTIFTANTAPESVWLWYTIGLLAAVAYVVGYKSRLASVVLFIITASAFLRNAIWAAGHESILLPLLFFSMFLPLSNAYSLDRLLVKKSAKKNLTYSSQNFARWPVRLMQITIALVYFFSGLSKVLDGASWRAGTAISILASSPSWFRYPDSPFFQNTYVSQWLSYSTLFFELSFIWLVWHKRLRPVVVLTGILFHVGLIFSMGPGILPFNLVMIAGLTLFIDPSLIKKLLLRVPSGLRRNRLVSKIS